MTLTVATISDRGQAKGDVLTFVEEKFERRLSEEIAKVNERITTEVAKLHETITVELGKVNERLSEEIAKVNERITTEFAKLNERITTEVARLDVGMARLRQDMAEQKAELIRWMFLFWIGQAGVTLGILFAFFRR